MKKKHIYLFHLLLLLLFSINGNAQSVPQGITYQGLARNSSGITIVSQAISVKLGIYSPSISGTLQWEETHAVITNQFGLFYFIIGQGTSTGGGASVTFSSINWSSGDHFIKIALDQTGGSSYVNIDTMQFMSVPYAMYSGGASTVNQSLRLNDLIDVDTIGAVAGNVLKWNGSLWVPAPDNNSDTALYAYNSAYSSTSDTADYAINSLSTIDTVSFSYNADSAAYSLSSTSSVNSVNSIYSDTATYALNSVNAWNLTGNSGTTPGSNFIGTIDNVDLVLKTNNSEKMRISAAGKIGIGTVAPAATLHIVGADGIVAEGTFGTGALAPSGGGTRMLWYSKKGAFRAGGVLTFNWDDANIGNYSFGSGHNTRASGAHSTAFGYACISSGANSISEGDQCIASGLSSVAMGSVCYAQGPYSISLGRSALASDTNSVAIGYTLTSSGKYSLAFGANTNASGDYSIAMGYHASTNNKKGSFVFADMSSTAVTNATADNQFIVRASGGTIFYSNTALTAGVSLAAGAGSWATVSDKNKKEHFKSVNSTDILSKISQMEITSWNYKSQSPSIRHIGPMAQDFYKAFNFGESDTTITTVDIDGVSLAAIQALAVKTNELQLKANEVEKLKAKIEILENDKKKLEKRITNIEKELNINKPYSAFLISNK